MFSPLSPQVVASQEKIARLEQEKEHWLLEAQLGRVRLEKESQRIQDLETQLSFALGGGGSPAHSLGQAPGSPALTSLEDGEVQERGAGKEAMLSNSLVDASSLLFFLYGCKNPQRDFRKTGNFWKLSGILRPYFSSTVIELVFILMLNNTTLQLCETGMM